MRAKEFITESVDPTDNETGLDRASCALPNTYVIPGLTNQDFYELYRFGLAIAAVRGEAADDGVQNEYREEFKATSTWGEHQVVAGGDAQTGALIDAALKKIGKSGKKLVSTPGSDEMSDTDTTSPIKSFKGYRR